MSRKNKEERVGAEYLLITDYVIWMVNNNKYIQAKMEFIGPERIAISVVTLAKMVIPLAKAGLEKYKRQHRLPRKELPDSTQRLQLGA